MHVKAHACKTCGIKPCYYVIMCFNKLWGQEAFGFPESKKPGVSQLPELAKLLKVPSVFE